MMFVCWVMNFHASKPVQNGTAVKIAQDLVTALPPLKLCTRKSGKMKEVADDESSGREVSDSRPLVLSSHFA